MKVLPMLLIFTATGVADDCALLPGSPLITVDHPNAAGHLPSCMVAGSQTMVTLNAPTQFDWQTFQINAGSQLVIVSSAGAAHASFHNVTGTAPAVINGTVTADGAFTLQLAAGGQIIVGETGRLSAPEITLTTQRAADSIAYLRTGNGRFDAVPGSQPLLRVEGNLRATGGAIKLIGSRLVQIGQHGKLEAPGNNVSVFSGPNSQVQSGSIAAAEAVDGENNIIQHFGIARGFRVEMHAVPDYDANLCALGFCGDQPGLYLGGEITASQVKLDTVHPFDPAVQNETVGSLTAVSPNSGEGFEMRTARFQSQTLSGPIDDDPPVIPAPVKLPGLETGVPATSQPLAVTYSHLKSGKPAAKPSSGPVGSQAVAVRGATQKKGKQTAKPVVRGTFFGVPVKGN